MRVRFVLLASATVFAVTTPVLAQGIDAARPRLVADFNGGYGPPRVYRDDDAPRYGEYREYRQPRYEAAPVYEPAPVYEQPAPVYEQAPPYERAEGYGNCRTITIERDDGSYRRFRRCD